MICSCDDFMIGDYSSMEGSLSTSCLMSWILILMERPSLLEMVCTYEFLVMVFSWRALVPRPLLNIMTWFSITLVGAPLFLFTWMTCMDDRKDFLVECSCFLAS